MSKIIKKEKAEAKRTLDENISAFADFARNTVENKDFAVRVKSQLPFEGVVNADMDIPGEKPPIRKLGVSAMRMDLEDTFSLGVTMSLLHKAVSVFLTVVPSYKGLVDYVNSDKFKSNAQQAFEKQIDQEE